MKIWGVQKYEKYVARILLKHEGFQENQIFYETMFVGSRPDILAE